MQNAILAIIQKIPAGAVFDTHTIIENLIQDYSDIYLSTYTTGPTAAYHGRIGKMVDALVEQGLIEKIGDSWSMNIRKQFSICACWKKR